MFYYAIDLLGTLAFTISGVLAAMDKKLDPFGIFIIGFVTALGGGTIRDLLLGVTPVTWLINPTYMYVIIATVILAVIFRNQLKYFRTSLFLFDTIGIGLYTVVGLEKGVAAGLHPIMCIALGTVSACFGGVLRDILCNEIPVIFRKKEIYATACVAGGVSYFFMKLFPIRNDIVFAVPIVVVIAIRLIAVKYKLSLPSVYRRTER
ncbi:trimeric intracellular cation channel family protein [Galbibacter sp. EGI 63066]|uniref:trimeric intracellular cation channel family protein n=1 Tax=Galbibacter sp. EGI 63066 TaxID=2993559 RepID=UPI0022498171|nr:trimeric intracellular cation channel family protein [Galbibacter sp. EGI 63066]MCX2681459.1 trimeric intracellular cation channel family protein [Galbibacter sp. EGI 63066]